MNKFNQKLKGLAGRKITTSDFKIKDTKYNKKYFENRRNELAEIFNSVKADLQEQADFFSPNAVRFLARNVNKPRVRSKKIKDSTTLIAVRNFSSGMMTGATSPTRRWFKTGLMNKDVENNHAVKEWCAKQAELTRKILYASNFYQLLPEVYDQLGVFLFSCLALESDYETVVNFKCLPIGSYFYDKDHRGVVDTVCRHYMQSAKNLIAEFGEENVSEAVKNAYERTPNQMFEIVHFVEPNKDYIKNSPVSDKKKYISVYYEVGNNENFLRKSGFDRFPYVIFEASCNGEDTYPSKGLGAYALPDAKQLMAMVNEYAKAVKKMVTPAYKGPASLKGKDLSDTPGHYNETDDNGNGLTPVYQVNPQVLELTKGINELRENIKSIFYNDLFAMILNTAERGRTATEVNELKEEKMVLLSPLLEQIHTALKQILEWIFEEEIRTGILPEYPEELQGQEIEIEFVSTLAQAMKAQNIASMERFTTFVANMGQAIDPVLLKKIQGEKMIDDYADFANIDPSQVTPTEQVAQYRAMLEQKQQQQEQISALQQGSQMVKNMGGADAFGGELMQRLGM
jgi:hypothetical protein